MYVCVYVMEMFRASLLKLATTNMHVALIETNVLRSEMISSSTIGIYDVYGCTQEI